MANSVNQDQTAPIDQTTPIEAVCSASTLFAFILNSSVLFGNFLQQTTSADDIFRNIFFLGAFRVNQAEADQHKPTTINSTFSNMVDQNEIFNHWC